MTLQVMRALIHTFHGWRRRPLFNLVHKVAQPEPPAVGRIALGQPWAFGKEQRQRLCRHLRVCDPHLLNVPVKSG